MKLENQQNSTACCSQTYGAKVIMHEDDKHRRQGSGYFQGLKFLFLKMSAGFTEIHDVIVCFIRMPKLFDIYLVFLFD